MPGTMNGIAGTKIMPSSLLVPKMVGTWDIGRRHGRAQKAMVVGGHTHEFDETRPLKPC